jgi:2TM domain-containing protein
MNAEEIRYEEARKRVEQLRYFYVHLGVYVLGNLFLFLLNMIVSPAILWFHWPLLGWGFGLVVHAFDVFASARLFGARWEERKIREIMENEQRA